MDDTIDNDESEDSYRQCSGFCDNQYTINHTSVTTWNKMDGAVTTLYRRESTDAKALYIFDSSDKLQNNDQYDIGGVYEDGEPALWFFFTTTTCPGYNYLLNVFVNQRKPGIFTVGISNSNTITNLTQNGEKIATLSNEMKWIQLNATEPDFVHYVKTYCFSDLNRAALHSNALVIPIMIDLNPKSCLNMELVQKIKVEHEFGEELLKDQEPDFILTSESGKHYKVHKIVLAAHSPVIRDAIRAKECHTYRLDISDEKMDLLLQYLYTGMINNILEQDFEVLFDISEMFQLRNLATLIYLAITVSINCENALAIAVLAEKYNSKEIQEVAFKYIETHPEILESEAFSEIDNANLVKKLLKYIHVKDSNK